jgi:hypothetical protein
VRPRREHIPRSADASMDGPSYINQTYCAGRTAPAPGSCSGDRTDSNGWMLNPQRWIGQCTAPSHHWQPGRAGARRCHRSIACTHRVTIPMTPVQPNNVAADICARSALSERLSGTVPGSAAAVQPCSGFQTLRLVVVTKASMPRGRLIAGGVGRDLLHHCPGRRGGAPGLCHSSTGRPTVSGPDAAIRVDGPAQLPISGFRDKMKPY